MSHFKLISYKSLLAALVLVLFFSCNKEKTLQFSETEIVSEKDTRISITIPNALGKSKAAKNINTSLKHFVNTALNIEGLFAAKSDTNESIEGFDSTYATFKKQMAQITNEPLPVWEAIIEGEKTYQDETIICFSMSSAINTGGANTKSTLAFFNFKPDTGEELEVADIISNSPELSVILESYLKMELNTTPYKINEFTDKETHRVTLPASISLTDTGVVFIYEKDADYIEFLVPYSKIEDFIKI